MSANARCAPAISRSAARLAAVAAALGLGLPPTTALADAPAPVAAPTEAEPAAPTEGDATPDTPATSEDDATTPESAPEPHPADVLHDPPPPAATSGEADDDDDVEADNDDADDEQSEDDDDDDDDELAAAASAPQAPRLRPMQTAAWWTLFGGFTLGTAAGVLSGLAERQEDRATRLATLFDSETGAQLRYADRQKEYERYLDRGEAYARSAIALGVVAGATTALAITLFALDAKRNKREQTARRPRVRMLAGGMEVTF